MANMNKELKFPAFAFQKGNNMIYTFFNDYDLKSTSTKFLNNGGFSGDTITDSSGKVYKIKRVFKVRYKGLWGFSLLVKGRQILVDFEYDEEVKQISLEDFKKDVIQRVEKTKNIWVSGWADINELKDKINEAQSFTAIAELLK